MEYYVELDVTALAGDVSEGMMVQVRGTLILLLRILKDASL